MVNDSTNSTKTTQSPLTFTNWT